MQAPHTLSHNRSLATSPSHTLPHVTISSHEREAISPDHHPFFSSLPLSTRRKQTKEKAGTLCFAAAVAVAAAAAAAAAITFIHFMLLLLLFQTVLLLLLLCCSSSYYYCCYCCYCCSSSRPLFRYFPSIRRLFLLLFVLIGEFLPSRPPCLPPSPSIHHRTTTTIYFHLFTCF